LRYSHIVVRAEGRTQVERAVVARVDPTWRVIDGTEKALDVDTVCLGYGFFPSNELARTCGCELRYSEDEGGDLPVRDEYMRTSVPGILAAGDGARVAGSSVAIEEGRLAGIGAALDLGKLNEREAHRRAAAIRRRLRTLERFRSALNSIYAVGPGIYELATADTVICRCEEVTASEILANVLGGSPDPNTVKSLTRAGMGLCQGRNCARQVASIVARQAGLAISAVPPLSSRAPVKPVPIGAIAEERAEVEASVESPS
jgi:NAD(P)H-nitrite reductase large subunit